ncbi:MAG: glycogen/starch/alpha-glucan phosphorylase, partial [bacterium]
IKENPELPIVPRSCLIGGKAAPGYYMAKLIIQFINHVADMVNRDPQVNDKLKVVFLPNYRVSLAEKLIPAADLSEQISTAGKEASGTGNMKFALNGAITIGTLDGANIEILEEVGAENIFIFGNTAAEISALWCDGYNPQTYIDSSPLLTKVIDMLKCDFFSPGQAGLFQPILDELCHHDGFNVCADFDAYVVAQDAVSVAFTDVDRWNRMSILNVARCSKFSSDRTINEYARDIWGVKGVEVPDMNKSGNTCPK